MSLPFAAPFTLIRQDAAASAFPTVTGKGVTVAVIDTGIDYTHPDLGGGFGPGHKVVGGFDFVDNDSDPRDTFGHGTANAGLIAALPYDFNGSHYQGIAPDANLVALRVSSGNDVVSYDTIDKALKWILANYKTYNISVVNFSFGTGRFTEPETNATISGDLKAIADAGIIFFSPSGNDGGVGILYPAADPSVVSVGSVNASDQISSFTNKGKLLDMLTPGEGLFTLGLNGGFQTVTDSSYCSPVAAGAAALIKQSDPKTGRNDMLSILRASGMTLGDGTLAYPRIDLYNAISLTRQRKASATTDVGINGTWNDMAYDSAGVLHFAYYDQVAHTLKYATRSTRGFWSNTQVVDGSGINVGLMQSIAVNSTGKPSIAYYDGANGDLKYARFDGRTWKKATLDSKGLVGTFPSLAFDSSDNPIIAYYRRTSGDLRVMRFTNSAWTRQDVDTTGDVGSWASLGIAGNGTIGVAYTDNSNGDLKYAQLGGSTWSPTTVDNLTAVAFVSLAFDKSNNPAISYYNALPADLKYATRTSNTWSSTTLSSKGAVGLFTNLWFDDTGAANIIYYNRRSNALLRLQGSGGNWTAQVLSLLGGVNGSVATTTDSSAAAYSWWNVAKNRIYTGDVT